MKLDIHAAVQTAFILTLIGALLGLWLGIRAIHGGRRIPFFRIRRARIVGGWWTIFISILLGVIAFFLGRYTEPVVYLFFPPTATLTRTATISLTPTITLTPTISLTPTITLTPAISDTPKPTQTPFLPPAIEAQFQSTVTPNPEAVFSPLQFAYRITDGKPVTPATVFQNPVSHMYAAFTYDKMLPGAQWTALWYRDGTLVYFETKPWDGEVGGYGFADWDPSPEKWLPGTYEVQIFVGMEWKVVGKFVVQGEPLTSTPTLTPSLTRIPTLTRTPSPTRTPSQTPMPSKSPTLTWTPIPSWTPHPTDTRWPSQTPTQ
jgi:hypothetical protein